MSTMNCTPVASPPLPSTHKHALWEVPTPRALCSCRHTAQAWDIAVEQCLAQLPSILRGEAEFESCSFFSDQARYPAILQ